METEEVITLELEIFTRVLYEIYGMILEIMLRPLLEEESNSF